MASIKVYEYSGCSTCRKALKFLEARKLAFEKVDITRQAPTVAELRKMLALKGGELRRLFNTSGEAYRELGLGQKLAGMSEAEALKLLASNGRLVKRPFVLAGEKGTVGFKEDEWQKLF